MRAHPLGRLLGLAPLGLALLGCPVAAPAQPAGPTPRQLDAAVRFGAIATLGPLCGLRDARWAADLRRSEYAAMGALPGPGPADPDRQGVTDRAGAALSYAEDEALEDFAASPPAATCAPLAHNPDLGRADAMVAAFRTGAPPAMW